LAIDQQTLALLRDPETHTPFELAGDSLLNPQSGRRYPIREGIPVFLEKVTGDNLKYQKMYDRLAPAYDIAERLYRWITRKDYRLEYIRELEVAPGARVLEVSVGTGANLRYLPAGVEFWGLDLSWGMLRRCLRNVARWGLQARLLQGEAERLPLPDAVFDCVFHVGGINFFSDKARSIREMIRVARPGTKIVIVDETEKVVQRQYRLIPATRAYFADRSQPVSCPIDLVPAGMGEIQARLLLRDKLYCLTFRKPAG